MISSNKLKWFFALSLMLLGLWGAKGIHLRDDVLDLLPGQAVRTDIEILQRLGLVNRVFISFEVNAGDVQGGIAPVSRLMKIAEAVGVDLKKTNMFREVVYRLDEGFEWFTYDKLWNYLPALSTEDDLAVIAEKLDLSSLEKIISDNFAQLNSPAGIPLVNQVRRDPLALIGLLFKRLEGLKGEFSMTINEGFFFSKDRKSCLIWAESLDSLTDSVNAQKIKDIIDSSLKQNDMRGVTVRIVGTLPHTLANAELVQNDLRRLLPLASISLLIFLLFSLRGVRAIGVMLIPLMAAPIAIALLNLIYDKISTLALGFGIVLMGIAVDFSIHLYLALSAKENRDKGLNDVVIPISLATLTTIGVFVVLLFSEVPSHRQMATFAIIGLVCAVFFSFLLIPTIISGNRLTSHVTVRASKKNLLHETRGAYLKIISWMLLILLGGWSWTQLEYDGDLRSLDVPSQQVIDDEQVFRKTWHHNESQTLIVSQGKSIASALEKNDIVFNKLKAINVSGVQSLSAILPSLKTQTENISNWSLFWANRAEKSKDNIRKIGEEMGFTADAFAPFFRWLDQPDNLLQPETLLNSPIRPILISMLRTPASDSQTIEKEFLVTTIVPDRDHLFSELTKVLGQEQGVTIISNSKWRTQVEKLLRHDIIRLSTSAGLLIVVLASLYFRNLRQTIAVLAPVLSALSAMAIYGLLTTGQLNMMHVLMGIMVIGISVDYGIFVVFANKNPDEHVTSKAVSICAVSTLIGFGVLAFADHYALSTLGATVLAGIGAAWPTALIVTPVILGARRGGITKWK